MSSIDTLEHAHVAKFFQSPYDPDQYNIDEVIDDDGSVLLM
jgi:hypothetical protein